MKFPLTKQGVRNLDVLPSRQESRVVSHPAPKASENEILDGPMQHDLLYDDRAYQDVRDRFPHASIEHDYNAIKGHRLVVEIPHCTLRTWLVFLAAEGWAATSLIFQFMMMDNQPAIEEVMDIALPGWRERVRERKRKKERR